MRRFFLAAFLTLFMLPTIAFAQEATPEPTALWNLNQELPLPDFGFWFIYPEGWVQDKTFGIHLAENLQDLDKALDPDNTTHPRGYVISLRADSLDQMHMKPDVKLDDAVDTIVNLIGLRETAVRLDVPVMTRRSVMVTADDVSGRPGIFNFWLQDGNLVTFGIDGPVLNDDVRYTWGLILSTVAPTNSLVLGNTPLMSTDGDFSMFYPENWVFNDMNLFVYELQSDFSAGEQGRANEGITVGIDEEKLYDINSHITDLESLSQWELSDCDKSVAPTQSIILGQPALTYIGSCPGDYPDSWSMMTVFILGDKGVVIGAAGHSAKRAADFEPTYWAMLQSIKPVQPSGS